MISLLKNILLVIKEITKILIGLVELDNLNLKSKKFIHYTF